MSDLENFNNECLYAHNGLREFHSVGPLTYNKQLAKEAQAYAEIIAAKDVMEHSHDRDNIGENLATCMRPFVDFTYSGLGATVSWYSEIMDYDFSKEQQTSKKPTGHFTQVVWKGTQEAGFGKAKNPKTETWYVVGRYKPAGNFLGQYTPNVPPLIKGIKWDELPIVDEYLDELRTMEYTDARKHVLDDWMMNMASGTNEEGRYFKITEIFTTPDGQQYNGEKTFKEDPTNLPRPKYNLKIENGIYNNFNGDDSLLLDDPNIIDEPISKPPRGDNITNFINALVDEHNKLRYMHDVDLLIVDKKLTAKAQEWAKKLAYKGRMCFSNFLVNDSQIGENISSTCDKPNEKSGRKLVEKWYEESKHYNYKKEPENFHKIGHFSQIVWKESQSIGVGVEMDESDRFYIVCFYYPPGNVANNFSKNVFPKKY